MKPERVAIGGRYWTSEQSHLYGVTQVEIIDQLGSYFQARILQGTDVPSDDTQCYVHHNNLTTNFEVAKRRVERALDSRIEGEAEAISLGQKRIERYKRLKAGTENIII